MGPLLPVFKTSTDPDFLDAALDKSAYAALFAESRMRSIASDELHRKSGGPKLL
jgi:hypothetical protein